MKNTFTFYPKIDNVLLQNANLEFSYSFSFFNELTNENQTIDFQIEGNKFISFGDDTEWSSYINDLKISFVISSSSFKAFFGPEGVAPVNSKLGIAVECICQKSKFRKVEEIIKIGNANELMVNHEIIIPKNTIEGDLELSIIVYLKEKAVLLDDNESFLNNSEGIILGTIDKKHISFEGQGALFPIFITSSESPKLWDLFINYDDPSVDKLYDSVKLNINKNHRDYVLIDEHNDKYCKRVVTEIIGSSLIILLSRLKEDGLMDVDFSKDYEPGTIYAFIKHLKIVKNIDIDSIIGFASSLREFVEKEDI